MTLIVEMRSPKFYDAVDGPFSHRPYKAPFNMNYRICVVRKIAYEGVVGVKHDKSGCIHIVIMLVNLLILLRLCDEDLQCMSYDWV